MTFREQLQFRVNNGDAATKSKWQRFVSRADGHPVIWHRAQVKIAKRYEELSGEYVSNNLSGINWQSILDWLEAHGQAIQAIVSILMLLIMVFKEDEECGTS